MAEDTGGDLSAEAGEGDDHHDGVDQVTIIPRAKHPQVEEEDRHLREENREVVDIFLGDLQVKEILDRLWLDSDCMAPYTTLGNHDFTKFSSVWIGPFSPQMGPDFIVIKLGYLLGATMQCPIAAR